MWLTFALASPAAPDALGPETSHELLRQQMTVHLADEAIPRWLGTPWAFYGTSTTPGKGSIACGYFVSTVLQQAGLKVERVKLAQQPSEYIVKTFASEAQLKRFRKGDERAVVDWVRTQEDGIYAIGLDFHTGLLVKRGQDVQFCHSSYVTDNAQVQCSDPLTDPGFQSRYHIVGPVFSDQTLDAYVNGTPIPTYQP